MAPPYFKCSIPRRPPAPPVIKAATRLFLTTYSFGLHHKKHGGMDKIHLKGGNRAKGYLKQTEKEGILSERVAPFKKSLGQGSSVTPITNYEPFFSSANPNWEHSNE